MKTLAFTDVDKLEADPALPSELDTLRQAVSDLTRDCYDLRAENRHLSHQRNDCTRALRDAQERVARPEDIDALRNENDRLYAALKRLQQRKRDTDHAALALSTMGRMRTTLAAIETAAMAASDARRQ